MILKERQRRPQDLLEFFRCLCGIEEGGQVFGGCLSVDQGLMVALRHVQLHACCDCLFELFAGQVLVPSYGEDGVHDGDAPNHGPFPITLVAGSFCVEFVRSIVGSEASNLLAME